MRIKAFAKRNFKELIRDPLMILLALGFPLVLILIFSLMVKNVPEMPSMFLMENLVPGMAVFGYSFLSLFVGLLIALDRDNSLMARLFASPMKSVDFLVGYSLPMLPFGIAQSIICFGFAFLMGLKYTNNVFIALLTLLPSLLLYMGLGLLLGSLFNSKQVGGFASILINVAAWLSGTWFDVNLIGGTFKKVCYCLPFAHSVDLARAGYAGDWGAMLTPLIWVLAYTAVIFVLAVILFRKKMKN